LEARKHQPRLQGTRFYLFHELAFKISDHSFAADTTTAGRGDGFMIRRWGDSVTG
jgi:hypothetical protein